ncbi:mucin-5AC-like, partial [Tachysurus ichikawai]
MIPYYETKIENFLNITNITLSDGNSLMGRMESKLIEMEVSISKSVKVKHDIVVQIENNNVNEGYNEVFLSVKNAVESVTKCTPTNTACPNFTVTDVQVNKTELDRKEYCDQVTAIFPEEYRQYFISATVMGKLTCINQCHPDHPTPKICMNKGTCEVSKQGPSCYCLQTDANWYLGEDCKYQVHKVGFYAGVAVVAVVLLIAIAMLSAYVFLNKRKEKRNKDNKEALVNQWIDDDFEWPSQKRTNTSLSVLNETYDNPAQSNENFSQSTTAQRTTSSTERYFPQFNLPENEISRPSLHNYP